METNLGSVTSTVYTRVGVISFGIDTAIVDDPFKSVVHVASVTSVIGGVAVDEFLLRKANEVPCDYGVDSFHGSG